MLQHLVLHMIRFNIRIGCAMYSMLLMIQKLIQLLMGLKWEYSNENHLIQSDFLIDVKYQILDMRSQPHWSPMVYLVPMACFLVSRVHTSRFFQAGYMTRYIMAKLLLQTQVTRVQNVQLLHLQVIKSKFTVLYVNDMRLWTNVSRILVLCPMYFGMDLKDTMRFSTLF